MPIAKFISEQPQHQPEKNVTSYCTYNHFSGYFPGLPGLDQLTMVSGLTPNKNIKETF